MADGELTKEQKLRYSRNIMLEGIGHEGQQKLLNARVLIVGAGALGSIAAMYLAASGVGRLTLVDYDTIDLSNLQRQLSFTTRQCGGRKVAKTAERIAEINPEIRVDTHAYMLTQANAGDIFAGHDLVVEGSDNPDTKYLTCDTCLQIGIPCITGGVSQFRGQLMSWAPGHVCYRDVFPESATADGYMPCSLGGILGPLPGIIASWQACEAIKIISGAGTPLYDKLLLIDQLHPGATIIDLK